MKKIITIFLLILCMGFTTFAAETASTDIYYESTYMPNGYKKFMAFKNYSGGHTVLYCNNTPSIRYNANYFQIQAQNEFFKIVTFDTLEELAQFCTTGATEKEVKTVQEVLCYNAQDRLYALNFDLVMNENETRYKHSYIDGKTNTEITTNPNPPGTDEETGILAGLKELINSIKDKIASVITAIQDLTTNIKNFFSEIINFITNIPEQVKSLVIPSDNFMAEWTAKAKEKFAFVDDIKTIFETFRAMIQPTKPPEIYINLPQKYGGKQKVLSFERLESSRADIQKFLSAFLWLTYSFLLIKQVPNIISGAGMMTETSGKIDRAKEGEM